MVNKNKLRGAIISAGFTQKELAEKLGMSENSFCSKMTGKSCFDVVQAYAICDILKITDNDEKVAIFLASAS